tara:strand:- start:71 stop:304 length:234 start_codon:yes stop_codon:yes gene_type:complete
MIKDLILMNGYGVFVWLSFFITITTCLIFYYKTLKTLKKYEREFASELNKLSEQQRKTVLEQSRIANQILASYNKSI